MNDEVQLPSVQPASQSANLELPSYEEAIKAPVACDQRIGGGAKFCRQVFFYKMSGLVLGDTETK